MDVNERERALNAARSLEKKGQLQPALDIYVGVGALDDAVRVLTAGRRYAEAAQLLANQLGAPAAKIAALPPDKRKQAQMAAILFGRAGGPHVASAVELFLGLGERERAAELLERSGDAIGAAKLRGSTAPARLGALAAAPAPGAAGVMTLAGAKKLEADGKLDLALQAYVQLKQYGEGARLAQKLGRTAQAGELWSEGGRFFEAADCFLQLGDTGRALDSLVRVSREDPRYRAACLQAIRLSAQLNALSFNFEHFLTRFVSEGPQDDRELEAFYALSKLYTQNDLLENAKEALRKILAVSAGYRDAAQKLEALERDTKGSKAVFQKITEEDAAFRSVDRRAAALPDLPDLPDLPGLPPLPGAPAARRDARPATNAVLPSSPPFPSPSYPPSPAPAPAEPIATPMPSPRGTVAREEDEDLNQPTFIGRKSSAPIAPEEDAPDGTFIRGPAKAPAPAAPARAAAVGPVDQAFAVGSTIADRYRLDQKVGQGGMAVVFKAFDHELEQEIAIKVFTQTVDDESLIARFKQELKLARTLAHPNVIRLYDIGVHGGYRYLTMELLVGKDLRSYLGRPLPLPIAINYLMQACAGLQAAHDQGVIHRDVKPDNFFVTAEGRIKVMDFGIAKQRTSTKLTVAGMIAGTPEYMSPEQINDFGSVTASTDLYALGVVAYEMLTGKLPFQHQEMMPLLMMHVNQPPQPLRAHNPALPPELEAAVLKCLAKKAAERFASCRDFAMALDQIRRKLG